MYKTTTTQTVAPVKSTGLSGLKNKVLNKYALAKPKIMAKLPFQSKTWKSTTPSTSVGVTQSSTVQNAQIAKAKAKGGLWGLKNKISTNGNTTAHFRSNRNSRHYQA